MVEEKGKNTEGKRENNDKKSEEKRKEENRPSNRRIGAAYEKKAAEYLRGLGYTILEQNFYGRGSELDLIVRDGEYLVFVEVKYRRNLQNGHPLEAVTPTKMRHIRKGARQYLQLHGYGEQTPCRFDVIGILDRKLMHIKNAF